MNARRASLKGPTLALLAGLTLAAFGQAAEKMDARALARQIDQFIDQRLKEEGVPASPRTTDAEFCRRVYLDLTGRIPSAEQAARFLDSKDPDKRAKLIDELLANENFGKHQSDIWEKMIIPTTSDNRRFRTLYPHLTKWLTEGFNKNRPWNEMVHDLLTVTGKPEDNGSVVFYLANATPDKITDQTTRLFLGVQLQCAQCHDHPFTTWKQEEYWGMAAFFTKVRFDGNPRQAAKKGSSVGLTEGNRGRRLRLPVGAKVMPPKYLLGEKADLDRNEPYRPAVAKWMTSKDNPFFARAMANRIWGQLFGRGIVNPVDDMIEENPPSHPELLKALEAQFKAHDFDVKYLFRAMCNSEAYQRTSKPVAGNQDAAPSLFARAAIKVMTPEQLFDSLTEALGPPQQPARRRGRNAGRRGGTTQRDVFVAFFSAEDNDSNPTEYEAGIPQALRLMNSAQFNAGLLRHPAIRKGGSPATTVEQLYLSTLSRRPTKAEQARMARYLRDGANPRTAYADILWALINTSEFTLNH
jgi:hypothetical protein